MVHSKPFNMKYILIANLLLLGTVFFSCKEQAPLDTQETVPASFLQQLKRAGFSTENVQKTANGYLVENDLLMDEKMFSHFEPTHLVIANEEHYRTTNLVTGLPRTITISLGGGVPASASNALNTVIAAYNSLNLRLRFLRVASGGHIAISQTNGIPYIASAGFPSGGNPFPFIRIDAFYMLQSANTVARIMAHEIGHCIGFRHTDFASQASPCGGVAPEPSGVGAIYIPGTPTGADATSWMMRCLNPAITVLFNNNDRVALNFVY
jgi:hypothetical protein